MKFALYTVMALSLCQELIPIPAAPVKMPDIRVAIISHKGCPPCVEMVDNAKKELKCAGWDFNGKHFTVINVSGKEGLAAYPTSIRYVDNKAVGVYSGLMTRDQLTDFFYTGRTP